MRAFIASQDGIPKDVNSYAAWLGFNEMGFETIPFSLVGELRSAAQNDIVVGGIGACQFAMRQFGIEPPSINYPDSLNRFLGRRVWVSTLDRIANSPTSSPIFIKPVKDKVFIGKVIREQSDLITCMAYSDDSDIICSEVVDFRAEWRCFVRYGKILDVRPYNGNWRLGFDAKVIEDAVSVYADAPSGYGIDFGVTARGETLLIEVNDGYALGSYGLQRNLYAQLLSARWSELMGAEDSLGGIGRHCLTP